MKKIWIFSLITVLFGVSLLNLIENLSAKSLDSWAKELNLQKKRKVSQKSTTIAAVRGVEEVSDVDPGARNFEAVKEIDSRSISQTQLDNFKVEGQLKSLSPESPKESVNIPSQVLEKLPSGVVPGALRPISLEEEIELGRAVAANVIAQFGLVKNEALTNYVNWVGLTVARNCGRPELVYHFAILDSDIINAFAAPGGYIFITRGLLYLLKDESQLAAVLGHEIAHVSQRHVLKEIQKSKLVNAAVPYYVKASAKKAQWMSQVSDLAIQMMWKGLSRGDELESDRVGVEFSSKSGYHPQSLIEVLEILKSRSQSPTLGKELRFLLSTHPDPETRLQSARNTISSLPAEGVKLEERFKKALQK